MILLPMPSPSFLLSPHATVEHFRRHAELTAKIMAFNFEQMGLHAFRQHQKQMAKQAKMQAAHDEQIRELRALGFTV